MIVLPLLPAKASPLPQGVAYSALASDARNMNYGSIDQSNGEINSDSYADATDSSMGRNGQTNDFLVLPEEEEDGNVNAKEEWYHIIANRIRYAQGYIFFYFFVLVLGMVVLVWSLYDFISVENNRRSGSGEIESRRHPLLLTFDIILVVSISVEVATRYFATTETFCNRCSNFADVALVILCILSLFLDFTVPLKADDGMSFFMFLNTCLLCFRGLWVFVRVVKIMMDRRKAQAFADMEENQVVFDSDLGDLQSYREFER